MAEAKAQLIVWDGGNNDFSFVKPDLQITVVDALRPRQVATHHPGEAVARADVIVINKCCAAAGDVGVAEERRGRSTRPPRSRALRLPFNWTISLRLRDGVLVVEDGPTITHGGMPTGAGYQAAVAAGAQIVDPRLSAAPELQDAYRAYPHIGMVLPAMGYGPAQLRALAATIDGADADLVISGTPLDLQNLVSLKKPVVRVTNSLSRTPRSRPLSMISWRGSKPTRAEADAGRAGHWRQCAAAPGTAA
jgi:predicted GTPase